MPALIHCIYVSAATHDFGREELSDLLQAARLTNRRLGVTGMLLYAEGTFFQILEGPQLTVDALYERISRDTRHTEVAKIIREPIDHRSFAEWTMGFSRISRRELAGLVGVNDFFGAAECMADLDEGRTRQLLAAFAEGRWRRAIA
jgi:hypothetical protein